MKKLKPEDLKGMDLRYAGNHSPAYRAVMNLEPGEILQLDPADWKRKSPPNVVVRHIEKKHSRKFTIATIAGNKGWVITRLS